MSPLVFRPCPDGPGISILCVVWKTQKPSDKNNESLDFRGDCHVQESKRPPGVCCRGLKLTDRWKSFRVEAMGAGDSLVAGKLGGCLEVSVLCNS